jgi:sugar lactone lactonase YvrE
LGVAAAVALAVALPLWPPGGGPPAWGRNLEKGASGLDVATVFGLFFFLAIAWWLSAAADRGRWPAGRRTVATIAGVLVFALLALRSADLVCLAGILLFAFAFFALAEKAEDRLAFGLVGTAFFLVLFAQRLYIYDRMNTFFKLYLSIWLLFAVGTAALAFRPAKGRGSFARWPPAIKGVFALLAATALFTSVTVARGALTDARPTRKVEPGGPTLDGLRYLEKAAPGEYRAVLWMRRTIRGTPVVLEAQGPSYQDFGRVSMMTGLPTVLGWEYHVQQRGNSPGEIARRREAVEAIYANPSADAIESLLRRYHVGYVFVGPLERRTYPRAGLAKFDTARQLFQIVYENPEVRIYRVVGGDSEDVISLEREDLPAPAPAGRVTEIVEPEEPPIISDTPAAGRPPFSNLKEPRDAAVDERGRLWVADFGHSRLRLFDAEGGYLGGWGGRGDGTYAFRELCGVATRGGDLYVADTWNGRVEAFTLDGAWKATARDLYGPRGIAAAPDGSVWVTDTGNHRLVVYDSNLGSPRLLGQKGPGPLQFEAPVGIAAGPSGLIYVCDTGNRRIQVLDREGRFVRAFPVPAWSTPGEPYVEVDAGEVLYVSDPSGNAVLELDPSGQVRKRWENDDAGRKLSVPTGLALDRNNRILYVVSSGENFISKMKLPERQAE